jgi:8-oxo-dGTP diphosphatase
MDRTRRFHAVPVISANALKRMSRLQDIGTQRPVENYPLSPAKPGRRHPMSGPSQTPPFSLVDLAWRTAYRLGFPLARIWWRLRRRAHQGALVAVYVGPALLLVRPSYRAEWNFPGGSVRHNETPEAAARREMAEEIGLTTTAPLHPAGVVPGQWDGRRDCVHFFELRLDRLPTLRLDNREIVAARLTEPPGLRDMKFTRPVAAYLAMTLPPDRP